MTLAVKLLLIGALVPVSYTHLDVYKRQVFGKSTDDSERVILKEEDFKISF